MYALSTTGLIMCLVTVMGTSQSIVCRSAQGRMIHAPEVCDRIADYNKARSLSRIGTIYNLFLRKTLTYVT